MNSTLTINEGEKLTFMQFFLAAVYEQSWIHVQA